MVWPAVQLLNFWCVPLQHRLMVVNTFALGKKKNKSKIAKSQARS